MMTGDAEGFTGLVNSLAGLSEIDWPGLGYHVYGDNQRIPSAVLDLLSDDLETRVDARYFLLGQGQDRGNIYDTTPYIVPSIVQIVGHDSTPDRAELIDHLAGVPEFIHRSQHQSIHMQRLCVNTYDALKAGLPTFTGLLRDGPVDVQLASTNLLQYMTDEVETLIPDLFACFENEPDEAVQVRILAAIKILLTSLEWPRYDLKDHHAPQLKQVVESHPSHRVRVAAARASVEVIHYPPARCPLPAMLSRSVPELLLREYFDHEVSLDFTEDYAPTHRANIIADLGKLTPDPMAQRLRHENLDPKEARLMAQLVLAKLLGEPTENADHQPAVGS